MGFTQTQNFFELFGLPAAYTINTEKLTARYRELQKATHPDRFAAGTDQDRLLAVQHTAFINDAYQTLKDSIKRGHYLLALAGVDVGNGESHALDSDFLMQQMELRERLDDIRNNPRADEAIKKFSDDLDRQIESLDHQLQAAFDSEINRDLNRALDIVRRMQYLARLHEKADDLAEELLV